MTAHGVAQCYERSGKGKDTQFLGEKGAGCLAGCYKERNWGRACPLQQPLERVRLSRSSTGGFRARHVLAHHLGRCPARRHIHD